MVMLTKVIIVDLFIHFGREGRTVSFDKMMK